MNMIALFDHEEIGNGTKQGAGSILLHDMLVRILSECGFSKRKQFLIRKSILCLDRMIAPPYST